MLWKGPLEKISDSTWEIPCNYKPFMKTPARIVMDENLLRGVDPEAIEQIVNVTALPGIKRYSIMLPDGHWGYGFPMGGVAATDAEEGVLSPGGIGFDINCGVRLMTTGMTEADVRSRLGELIRILFKNVPSGLGSKGRVRISTFDMDYVLKSGARWAVEKGYGFKEDLERIEENGEMKGADASRVSERAKQRGASQLGSLGSGNHFLEVEVVDKIFDKRIANKFGITRDGQVVVMVHTGSRGCGHQICSDYLQVIGRGMRNYGIVVPDRMLACVPVRSREGEDYFAAMRAGANFAFANRQMISHWTRESFLEVFGEKTEIKIVYDVAHNIAKLEEHAINGKKAKVYVHRKGSTRAFGPGRREVPEIYRDVGQPVIVAGDMGTGSYLLVGTKIAMESTFGSSVHGAGRAMSRAAARRRMRGEEVKNRLAKRGIVVWATSLRVLAEEGPEAYKRVDDVAAVAHKSGISSLVAKMRPMGVAKG